MAPGCCIINPPIVADCLSWYFGLCMCCMYLHDRNTIGNAIGNSVIWLFNSFINTILKVWNRILSSNAGIPFIVIFMWYNMSNLVRQSWKRGFYRHCLCIHLMTSVLLFWLDRCFNRDSDRAHRNFPIYMLATGIHFGFIVPFERSWQLCMYVQYIAQSTNWGCRPAGLWYSNHSPHETGGNN